MRDTALTIFKRGGASIRTTPWHYLNYEGKGEELYDMVKDPHQYTNEVDNPEYSAILKKARAKHKQRIKAGQIEWKKHPQA